MTNMSVRYHLLEASLLDNSSASPEFLRGSWDPQFHYIVYEDMDPQFHHIVYEDMDPQFHYIVYEDMDPQFHYIVYEDMDPYRICLESIPLK